jgi:IS30 family transposase
MRSCVHDALRHGTRSHEIGRLRSGEIQCPRCSEVPHRFAPRALPNAAAKQAEHKAFTVATDMDVYFCDPGSPWQRGTSENTNGLLRQYLPKGADLRQFTFEQLVVIAEELNGRPRKSLGWDTPAERIAALLEPA